MTDVSGTVYFTRTEEYNRLSLEEKEDLFLQTCLVDYGVPIDINALNQLWLEKLKEKNITDLETGVKYRHRDFAETIYSDQDSLFFANSSRIDWCITGIYQEIDLQGHYNFSFKSLYQYAQKKFLIFIFIGGLLIFNLIICFLQVLRLTPLKVREVIQSVDEKSPIVVLDYTT